MDSPPELSPRPTSKQRNIGLFKAVQEKEEISSQEYETENSDEEADFKVENP